jgi:hypothetical protein
VSEEFGAKVTHGKRVASDDFEWVIYQQFPGIENFNIFENSCFCFLQ